MTGTDTDFVAVKQYENNYTRIVVEDFTPEEDYNYICVYKKLDNFCGCHRENVVYEVPFVDNTIYVDNYITNELGTYLVAIVAINANDETIAIGSPFRIEVIKGVYTSNMQAPSLPEPLESKYQQLVNLIDEVTYKLETGAFDGFSPIVNITNSGKYHYLDITDKAGTKHATIKDGDDYVITEADYEEIAEMTTQRIQPTLNKKMEYYKVVIHGNTIYHDDEVMTFNKLVELYNDVSVFLYMEVSHLTLIPNSLIDDMLTFGTAYFNTTDSHIYQVDINANNEVVFHFNSLEVDTNKIQSINVRNKNNEKYYPSNKAVTTYVDNGLALKADKTELEAETTRVNGEITRLEEAIAEKGKVDDVKVNGVSVVTDKVANIDMYSKAEIDAKIEQAKPADYEQLKAKVETHDDEIAFLKWAVSGEYTEVVDSNVAYSKAVPNNVYENALLNKIGGKTMVENMLVDSMYATIDYEGATTTYNRETNEIEIVNVSRNANYMSGSTRGELLSGNSASIKYEKNSHKYYYSFFPNYEGLKLCVFAPNGSPLALENLFVANFDVSETFNKYYFRITNEWDFVNLNPIGDTKKAKLLFTDLTKAFGVGNEPTLEQCKSIFRNFMRYNEGSLVNAEVQRIVSRGANLVETNGIVPNQYKQKISLSSGTYSFGVFNQDLTYDTSSTLGSRFQLSFLKDGSIYFTPRGSNPLVFTISEEQANNIEEIIWFDNIGNHLLKLEKSNVATPYTPYFESVKPIASIIEKYFPNKMKGFNGVYDYFDLENGKAIQRIEKHSFNGSELITLYQKTTYRYVQSGKANGRTNLLSNKFNVFMNGDHNQSAFGDSTDYLFVGYNAGENIYFNIPSATSVSSAKDFLTNSTILYELATPIVTDIDQADLEYLEALKVESNGTITFEQLNTYIQIPNEESYIKKVD